MSEVHNIKIKWGYTDGTLKLSGGPRAYAKNKDFVSWSIDEPTKPIIVKSIELINKKPGSPEIFLNPPVQNGNEWMGAIKHDNPDYTEYKYFIKWKDDGGNNYTYDPIISIRPSSSIGHLITVVVKKVIPLLLAIVLGLFIFKSLQRNRK